VVQARALVSTQAWGQRDGKYNYEDMFTAVVKLFFKLPDDEWAVETLAWYQK
jgi:hypothetical protein